MKLGLFIVLLASVLLIAGCINYSEENWLNGNGSGKLKMEISIPEQLAGMMNQQDNESDSFSAAAITKEYKNIPGIKLGEVKTFNRSGFQVTQINLEFNSPATLNKVGSNHDMPGFVGKISLKKNKKGQLVYTRRLEFSDSNEKYAAGNEDNEFAAMGEKMASAMMGNFIWKYTVHFPYKVISANTAAEYINPKTNTVKWDIPLGSLTNQSQTMTATLKAPFNLWDFFKGLLGGK